MKTLKTIILALISVISFSAAQAKTIKPDDEKLSVNYAVNAYVNAITHGQNKGISEILDADLKFSMVSGDKTLSYNKDQVLSMLKTSENIKQQCTTSVSINGNTPTTTVAKIDMKYKDFTRTNYVTLTKGDNGWKITNIYSLFN